MIPILVERGYDLTKFFTSDGKAFFTSDNKEFIVMTENAAIPENNGLGLLSSAISCKVHRFGKLGWELEMEYPVNGVNFDQIKMRDVIVAEADPKKGNQPFRVYKITKPLNGVTTVYAYHIIYDLMGIPVMPYQAPNIVSALEGLKKNAAIACPFTFSTERTTEVAFNWNYPAPIWDVLGGTEGSLLDVYTGEYDIDGYHISFENSIGEDNGVTATYGVNLIDLKQEENCANCYTGIIGYYNDNEDHYSYTPIIKFDGDFNYSKILCQDMSSYFEYPPTISELSEVTEEYARAAGIGSIEVSWTVKFIQLSKTVNYKDISQLDKVGYGDTVTVKFPRFSINSSSRVVETEYNVLVEQYDSISLGSTPTNVAITIANQQAAIENSLSKNETKNLITKMSSQLTDDILGAKGGVLRFLDSDNDGVLDSFYISDNPNPLLARKVWRYNYQGWAASTNGFEGPFVLGATIDSGIIADFITGGTLRIGGSGRSGNIYLYDSDGNVFGGLGQEGFMTFDRPTPQYTGYSSGTDIYKNMNAITRIYFTNGQMDTNKALAIMYSGNIDNVPQYGVIKLFNLTLENSNTITLNGQTGRIDCKELYVNGHRIT